MKEVVQGLRITANQRDRKSEDVGWGFRRAFANKVSQTFMIRPHHKTSRRQVPSSSSMATERKRRIMKNMKDEKKLCNDMMKPPDDLHCLDITSGHRSVTP